MARTFLKTATYMEKKEENDTGKVYCWRCINEYHVRKYQEKI